MLNENKWEQTFFSSQSKEEIIQFFTLSLMLDMFFKNLSFIRFKKFPAIPGLSIVFAFKEEWVLHFVDCFSYIYEMITHVSHLFSACVEL